MYLGLRSHRWKQIFFPPSMNPPSPLLLSHSHWRKCTGSHVQYVAVFKNLGFVTGFRVSAFFIGPVHGCVRMKGHECNQINRNLELFPASVFFGPKEMPLSPPCDSVLRRYISLFLFRCLAFGLFGLRGCARPLARLGFVAAKPVG